MFDFIEFVRTHRVEVKILPATEEFVVRLEVRDPATGFMAGDVLTDSDMHMVYGSPLTGIEAKLVKMCEEMENRREAFYDRRRETRVKREKKAELEKFWKESTPIFEETHDTV